MVLNSLLGLLIKSFETLINNLFNFRTQFNEELKKSDVVQ